MERVKLSEKLEFVFNLRNVELADDVTSVSHVKLK